MELTLLDMGLLSPVLIDTAKVWKAVVGTTEKNYGILT